MADRSAASTPPGLYDPGSPDDNRYFRPSPFGSYGARTPGGQVALDGPYGASTPGGQVAPDGPYGTGTPGNGNHYFPGTLGEHYPPGAPGPAHAFSLDLRRLSRVDQTIGGASLVLLISLFLPWFGVSGFDVTFSISGTSAHGYLVIGVILAVLLIAYLVLRCGWDEFPVNLPVAHAPLLLIGTGMQFLLVVIGFFDEPSGLSWQIGAYLGLIAATVAAGPVVIPAIRSWQASR